MSEILEGQTLVIKNALSLRAKLSEQEFSHLGPFIDDYFMKTGASNAGCTLTANHEIITRNENTYIDFEIRVSVNKKIEPPQGFTFEDEFTLENCLSLDCGGVPDNIMTQVNLLAQYIKENNLTPRTPVYSVTYGNINDTHQASNIKLFVGVSKT